MNLKINIKVLGIIHLISITSCSYSFKQETSSYNILEGSKQKMSFEINDKDKLEIEKKEFPLIFKCKSGDTIQKLEVLQINKNSITFNLIVQLNKTEIKLVGKANLIKREFDRESIMDENNELYFVDEYNFVDDNYDFILRVDINRKGAAIYGIAKKKDHCLLSGRFMGRG